MIHYQLLILMLESICLNNVLKVKINHHISFWFKVNFELFFVGFLKEKTCVLITHQLQYLNSVDQIILMQNVSYYSGFFFIINQVITQKIKNNDNFLVSFFDMHVFLNFIYILMSFLILYKNINFNTFKPKWEKK